MRTALLTVVVGLALLGCGGKSGREACDGMAASICARYSECGAEGCSQTDVSQACCSGEKCQDTVKDECDTCKEELKSYRCDFLAIGGMPASCKGCVKPY